MQLTVILFLILAVACHDYVIRRNITCVSVDHGKCLQWSSSGEIIRVRPQCFPAETNVMSKQGSKKMSQLKIGDQILGYNLKTKKNQYTPVIAWLHRIPKKTYEYEKVKTQHLQFCSSAKHLMAINESGKIQFVFTQSLIGKTLVSSHELPYELKVLNFQLVKSTGIYAPYTSLGNYFIEGQNLDKSLKKSDNVFILAHSFAHVRNPETHTLAFQLALQLSYLVGGNRQPTNQEQYIHPLSFLFSRFFPSLYSIEGDNPFPNKFNSSSYGRKKDSTYNQLAAAVDLLCQGPNSLFL